MNDNLPAKSEFLVYQTDDGRIKIDVRLEDETVWLTQQLMADLFQTSKQNINHHIKSIYAEGELSPEATVKKYLTVQKEGERQIRRHLDYYNLDMIISVGYRVKSHVATRFRIWATQRLKEYIVKGFVIDDERLKNPPVAGSVVPDYFDEMLARIRDILNIDLIRAPRECIDYVVVHELCHIQYKDHGLRFYNLLEKIIQDWKDRKQKLELALV
jgi:hypothetical protein